MEVCGDGGEDGREAVCVHVNDTEDETEGENNDEEAGAGKEVLLVVKEGLRWFFGCHCTHRFSFFGTYEFSLEFLNSFDEVIRDGRDVWSGIGL